MNTFQKIVCCGVSAILVLSATACEESEPSGVGSSPALNTTSLVTTADPDENAPTDAPIKEVSSDSFTPDGNSGTIKWLGYYDLAVDGKSAEQYKIFTSETYGGTIEYISCASGTAYFEKMGILIAADDSPDIVSYEWKSFPYGMSKNLYEPLDGLIDLESPLWSGMADIVNSFAYNGKRYYYPYRIATNYALNYNREVLKEYSLPDPYDLYVEGNWTWDTFEELLIDWCNADDEHIGYAGEGGMSFIATTGTKLVSVNADGTISNNINDPNVTRAMEFCSSLYRNGLVYQDEFNEWVSPQVWARNSRRLLFLGMNPEWTYTAAAAEIQNKQGVDNDILNTVSEFAFVPFPRDPSSDKYTIAYDTFGYMVAKGAKNKKGALDWINLNRVYETDENVIATKKKDSVNPENQFFTSGKYEGSQKWTLIWDEKQYDLWQDMMNPEKFDFVFDNCWGISDEMNGVCEKILFDPIFKGESWTQLSAEYSPVIDGLIQIN